VEIDTTNPKSTVPPRLQAHGGRQKRRMTRVLPQHHFIVAKELVRGHFQVEWSGSSTNAARPVVVRAVARAEPTVIITRVSDGYTAQVRAHTQHDQPADNRQTIQRTSRWQQQRFSRTVAAPSITSPTPNTINHSQEIVHMDKHSPEHGGNHVAKRTTWGPECVLRQFDCVASPTRAPQPPQFVPPCGS
jgi:hypothetical protein